MSMTTTMSNAEANVPDVTQHAAVAMVMRHICNELVVRVGVVRPSVQAALQSVTQRVVDGGDENEVVPMSVDPPTNPVATKRALPTSDPPHMECPTFATRIEYLNERRHIAATVSDATLGAPECKRRRVGEKEE